MSAALRIGTAPDSWGVWFADDPRQTPPRRFLDEAAEAGYRIVELGPYGYLPTDPAELADELAARDLTLAAGTVFTGFHKDTAAEWQRAWDQALKVAALAASQGARHLVVIPDLWRSDQTGDVLEERELTAAQWAALAAGHDRLGKAVYEEFGLHQQFHSHADSHIGTPAQVERLLDETDPRHLSLCLDTGHFAYYGGDSERLVRDRPDRIGYLHLKQVDPVLLERVHADDVPFSDAVADGIMIEPPAGAPDLVPVVEAVAAIDPDIVAIVEQDMYPVASFDDPLPIARRTLAHLLASTPAARVV